LPEELMRALPEGKYVRCVDVQQCYSPSEACDRDVHKENC